MLKRLLFVFPFILCLLPACLSYGFETKGQDCAKCHTLGNDEARELLKGVIPDIKIIQIKISPLKAFWEVFSESRGKKGLVYVDFSKKYLVLGSLVSIKERKNMTQEEFNELNRIDLSEIPLTDALVLGSPEAKIRIISFSDPD